MVRWLQGVNSGRCRSVHFIAARCDVDISHHTLWCWRPRMDVRISACRFWCVFTFGRGRSFLLRGLKTLPLTTCAARWVDVYCCCPGCKTSTFRTGRYDLLLIRACVAWNAGWLLSAVGLPPLVRLTAVIRLIAVPSVLCSTKTALFCW